MPNYVSKLKFPNNAEFLVKDPNEVIIYSDGSSIYSDPEMQDQLEYDSFAALIGQGAKKVYLQNGHSIIPTVFSLTQDDATIEFASFSQNLYITYKATAEGQTFSITERPIVPEGIIKINFCRYDEDDGQGSATTRAYLDVTEAPDYLAEYIREMISEGETDQFWMELLGTLTGSFGEQGQFSCVFRYSIINLDDRETFGVYTEVSAESKLQLDQDYKPSLDSYSIFSMPFELDGQMKYAVISKATTQVSEDYIDLNIQILDYTVGGDIVELPTTYDDQTGLYTITTTKTISDLLDDFNSGKSIFVSFDDGQDQTTKILLSKIIIDETSTPAVPLGISSALLDYFNGSYTCYVEVVDGGSGSPSLTVIESTIHASTADSADKSQSSGAADAIYDKVWYAVCNTSASTAAKVATIQKDTSYSAFSLEAGDIVFVNFKYANSSTGSITLNVSNTGAVGVRYQYVTNSSMSGGTALSAAGQIVAGTNIFMYNGSYWYLLSTNTDFRVWQANTTTSAENRVLLGAASDNNAATTTVKSANLKFNPSTSSLTVGNGTSTGSVSANTLTLGTSIQTPKVLAPTTSGGSTYGVGTNGQVLTSNGTTTYWGDASSKEPVLLHVVIVEDEEYNTYLAVANANGTVYKQSQLITLYEAGNTFALHDNSGTFSYAPGLPLTVPMDVIEDYSSGYGDPCYTAATPFFLGGFDSKLGQEYDQGICAFVQFFSENFVGTDEDAKLYIIRTSNNAVTQTNTTSNSAYRVLLSHSDNDTNETDATYKSGNLTFNPSTGTLALNNRPVRSTIIIYFGQDGNLYKDSACTTRYTIGDFRTDLVGDDAMLFVNAGNSSYPATYSYSLNGTALRYARITCLVNEANTLYTGEATNSTGAETFTVSTELISKVPSGGTQGQVLTKTSGSDYAVSWQTPSGTAPQTGASNPTTSTSGTIGQMYLNTTTEIMFVCTYATSGTYHWKPITFESAENQVG